MPATVTRTRRIEALEARRDELVAAMNATDDLIIERGSDFTEEERAAYDAQAAELTTLTDELPVLIAREEAVTRSRSLSASLGAAANATDGNLSHGDSAAGPALEVYRNAPGAPNFVLDLYRSGRGDRDSVERLDTYRQEVAGDVERAASLSTDLGGLVVPKYAIDLYQPLAVKRRVFLNTLDGTPSSGTLTTASVSIPIETAAASVDVQATENTAFASTAWATTPLVINANTIGGYSDVTVQAIQLGQVREAVVFQQMLNRYYERQDYMALWGSGASGQPEGLFNADGTQTVDGGYTVNAFAEIYQAVNEAASKIETADEREAQYVLMSSARWRSLQGAMDSTGRPLAGYTGTFPMNVGAYVDGTGQKWFAGIRAVTTNAVVKSGEQDTRMAVYNTDFCYFEESNPYTITADQVVIHQGAIRFATYGFMIWSPEVRVNSLCLINNLGVPRFPINAIS